METYTKYSNIIKEIMNFKPLVRIDASLYSPALINNLLKTEPKLLFYIESMSVKYSVGIPFESSIVLNFKYRNREQIPSDIIVVGSKDDVISALCQMIGNYRKNFGIIATAKMDISDIYYEFEVHHSSFYPNFLDSEIYTISLSGNAGYLFNCSYRIGRVKLNMMEIEISSEVDRLARQLFIPGISEEAKVYLAHNYLATQVKYYNNDVASDLEKSYFQSAYGALINKKCVCQGYAEAFKRLLEKGGVACDVVCGKVFGSDNYHAWNIVRFSNGNNFHFDVTWDVGGKKPKYEYFAKQDSFFKGKRNWNIAYNVRCNGISNILQTAKSCVYQKKAQLLKSGVPCNILDV